MKTNKHLLIAALFVAIAFHSKVWSQSAADSTANEMLKAQEEIENKPPGHSITKFLLTGNAMAYYQSSNIANVNAGAFAPSSGVGAYTNSFFPGRLMLMPLATLTDKIFFQGQVEIDGNAGKGAAASVAMNELIFYYKVNPYINAFFGFFNPRFGLYNGILDDFTNRYGTAAVGLSLATGGTTGAGIQGGIQTGLSKINYQLYVCNGPALNGDTAASNKADGTVGYSFDNNNNTLGYGGNFGWLPFQNSCLEVDVSALYKPKVGDAGSIYQNVSYEAYSANLNYYHVFSPWIVRAQAEWNTSTLSSFNNAANPMYDLNPGYSNQLSAWYAGASFRFIGAPNKFIRQLELGGRVGAYNPPTQASWGGAQVTQTTLCLTYWNTYKAPYNLSWDHFTTNGVNNLNVFTFRTIYVF